jgi:hypothetical protein
LEPLLRQSPRPSDLREAPVAIDEPVTINSRRPSVGAPHSRPTPVRRVSSIRIDTKLSEETSDRRRKSGITETISRTLSGSSHSPRSPRRQTVGNILKKSTGTASKPLSTVPEVPAQPSQRPAYIRRAICGDSFTIVEVSEAVSAPHGEESTDDEAITHSSPSRVTFATHVSTADNRATPDDSDVVRQPFLRLTITTAREGALAEGEVKLATVTPALLDKEWVKVREECDRQAHEAMTVRDAWPFWAYFLR